MGTPTTPDKKQDLKLDRMPLLVLETVCENLTDWEARTFALVNSACCNGAARARFRCLQLSLRNTAHLRKWEAMLTGGDYLPLVRSITIVPWRATQAMGQPVFYSHAQYDQQIREVDEYCVVLTQLLKRLSNLKTMLFHCDEMVPGPLLAALHEHRPNCRLSVSYFNFRGTGNHTTATAEQRLATSPCLHSIVVRHLNPVPGINQLVMRMVNGGAPNLKHVTILPLMMPTHVAPAEGRRTPAIDASFLPVERLEEGPKGALETLFVHSERRHPIFIEAWARHTNFAALRSLQIGGEITYTSIEALVGIARAEGFQNLETLNMSLMTRDQEPGTNQLAVDKAAAELVGLLPRKLDEVSITGFIDEVVVDKLLARHGPNLRNVQIHPVNRLLRKPTRQFRVSAEYIDKLARMSPGVTDLRITIQRNEGDAREVAAYRALGRLPRLRRLTLDLECSQTDSQQKPQPPPVRAMRGATVSLANVRRMFVNAAVDEDLVLAIRAVVGSPTLEELRVEVHGAGNFGTGLNDEDLVSALDWISRGWRCAPNRRTGRLDVDEVMRTHVLQARQYFDNVDRVSTFWFGGIWRELWPQADVEWHWRESWGSSPLQTTIPTSG